MSGPDPATRPAWMLAVGAILVMGWLLAVWSQGADATCVTDPTDAACAAERSESDATPVDGRR